MRVKARDSQPRIIMPMEKIFSYSVNADTLPNPTLVIQDNVKYSAVAYAMRVDGPPSQAVCIVHTYLVVMVAVWCRGNALVLINAVALYRARLVLGRVTAFG